MAQVKQINEVLIERAAQVQRGSARAAVLGVNDGLVSTLCLVVGVAAAGAEPRVVILTGIAGLLAGSISMAAGEWVSIKAQVELFEGILGDLRGAIKQDRELLRHNLAHKWSEYGVDTDDAHQAATDVATDDDNLLSVYSAQVIGINKDELGSPLRAALSSFLLFALGSLVPLTAWLIGLTGHMAIGVALAATSLAGLFVGGFTAYSSGRHVVLGALRQFLIIVLATIVTYGAGYIFGVSIS